MLLGNRDSTQSQQQAPTEPYVPTARGCRGLECSSLRGTWIIKKLISLIQHSRYQQWDGSVSHHPPRPAPAVVQQGRRLGMEPRRGGQWEGPDWESGDQRLLQVSHVSEGWAWGCSHGFLQQKFLWVPQPWPGPGRAWDQLQQLLLSLLLLLPATALGFPKEYPSPLSAINLKPKSRHVIWPDQSVSSILSPQWACLVLGTWSKLHE